MLEGRDEIIAFLIGGDFIWFFKWSNLKKVFFRAQQRIRGRTVTLKVKYADFRQITRSRTGQVLFSTRAEVEQLIPSL